MFLPICNNFFFLFFKDAESANIRNQFLFIGQKIQLTFTDFAVESSCSCDEFEICDDGSACGECPYDWVIVYDGDSASAKPLLSGKKCGTNIPGPFTSSGNFLYVVFHVDDFGVDKGFSATYYTYNP